MREQSVGGFRCPRCWCQGPRLWAWLRVAGVWTDGTCSAAPQLRIARLKTLLPEALQFQVAWLRPRTGTRHWDGWRCRTSRRLARCTWDRHRPRSRWLSPCSSNFQRFRCLLTTPIRCWRRHHGRWRESLRWWPTTALPTARRGCPCRSTLAWGTRHCGRTTSSRTHNVARG